MLRLLVGSADLIEPARGLVRRKLLAPPKKTGKTQGTQTSMPWTSTVTPRHVSFMTATLTNV
jgi:hypothetical protein